MPVLVAALGGNALLRRGEAPTAAAQQENAARAARALAGIAPGQRLVVTHGNGPQIGMLALQAAGDGGAPAFPLDVLGAETEGMIGYVIEQELAARLPGREVATLLTRVVVDPDDPAFAAPTKPVGPVWPEAVARRHARDHGWTVRPDGDGFRRVVPSPRPLEIRELPTIRRLVDQDVVVICAGGGGIPVAPDARGVLRGVEAVIDKDRASALLARGLGADALLLLTDVDALYTDWPGSGRRPGSGSRPGSGRRPVREAGIAALRALDLDPGSMGPKVVAACDFVASGGGFAGIGALEDAGAVLAGRAGTRILPGEAPLRHRESGPG